MANLHTRTRAYMTNAGDPGGAAAFPGPTAPGETGKLSSYEPSWRDRLAQLIGMGGEATGMQSRDASAFGRQATGLADFVPGVGSGLAASEIAPAIKRGDYGTAALNTLGAVPEVGGAAKAMFIGLGARYFKTEAGKAALKMAKGMEKLGHSRDDILKATGLFKQHDNWIKEISDADFRMTDEARDQLFKEGKVSGYAGPSREAQYDLFGGPPKPASPGLFHHPRMFDEVPGLADVPVTMETNYSGSMGGAYYPPSSGQTEKIDLLGGHSQQVEDVALHEFSHAAANRTGLPRGGSPSDKTLMRPMQKVTERAKTMHDAIADARNAEIDREMLAQGMNPNNPTERWKKLQAWKADPANAEKRRQLDQFFSVATGPKGPMAGYHHLAGEVNARNIPKRAGLGEEDLRNIGPWETQDLPDELQIVRYNKAQPDRQALTLYHGSPTPGLTELNKSGRGPLGPGVYASDTPHTAGRYGPHEYKFEFPTSDIFQGMKNRDPALGDVNPYDVWRDQAKRVVAAADPDKQQAIQALFDKMWPEDGYPMFRELARLHGSDEAAQQLLNKAGYRGVSGFVDGPEYSLFDKVKLGGGGGVVDDAGRNDLAQLSTNYHPVSRKNKLSRPLEEMTAEHVPTDELLPRKELDPQALQGSLIFPATGDRTAAGQALTKVNETPLATPVPLQGGPGFMRGPQQQAEGAVWANDKVAASALSNRIKRLSETGQPVNMAYAPMSHISADFSDMMARSLLGQMQGAKIAAPARKAFDEALKGQLPSTAGDWPGVSKIIKDPSIAERFVAGFGNARDALAKLMEAAPFQKAGFPDVAATRKAVSDPTLLNTPNFTASSVARMDPEGRLIKDPAIPHRSYNTQIGGSYLGDLPDIPRDVMYPDWVKSVSGKGMEPSQLDYTFRRQLPVQEANQQWLDGVMEYLRQRLARGGQ